jgi:hypothetical protein
VADYEQNTVYDVERIETDIPENFVSEIRKYS